MKTPYEELAESFCTSLCQSLLAVDKTIQTELSEIRIPLDGPIQLTQKGKSFYLHPKGKLSTQRKGAILATKEQMEESLLTLCGYSVHSHMWELKQGFVTIKGGHRVGISGFATYEDGQLKSFKRITSYVGRIARSFEGCSDELVALLWGKPTGVLIASEPGGGKTTLLCDLITHLSHHYSISVVDERLELHDRLKGTGVSLLGGMKKAEGILLAVRSLAPQLIFCDEIGDQQEIEAVKWALHCGVPIITTVHASSLKELQQRKAGQCLLSSQAFEYGVFLDGRHNPGKVKEVITLVQFQDDRDSAHHYQRRAAWTMAGR